MSIATQTGVDRHTDRGTTAGDNWLPFEDLVGEAFRRRGYRVDNAALGLDGGLDLALHRDGKRVLVQCKQWRQQPVGVEIVQEMADLLDREHADHGMIASLGGHTVDATKLAAGKRIELIDADTLLGMIRDVRANPAPTQHA